MGWLSFTCQKQQGYLYDWNNIYEGRYYSLVIFLLQMGFSGRVFLTEEWKKKLWQKGLIVFGGSLLIIEVRHNIYFHVKVIFHFKEYKAAVYRKQDYNYFNTLLPRLEKENPGYEMLVAAPGDDFYTTTASCYGKKGIYKGVNLKEGLPLVTRKSLLVVMLYNNEPDSYQEFISGPGVKKLQQADYSNFFLAELAL